MISEIKNTIFGLKRKKDTAEELISNLEDRAKELSCKASPSNQKKKREGDLKYERKVKTSKKF